MVKATALLPVNKKVADIVRMTLTDLFGEQTAETILSFCEKNGLPLSIIPERLVQFGTLLRSLLGEMTANSVNSIIARNIMAEFHMSLGNEMPTLEEASMVVWNQRRLRI
jgi:hypothetical protein